MSQSRSTPQCDALARNALDSNDISAWYSLAYSLEKQLSVARSESAPLTDEDKRWRFLEHGCQWVSWTPTGGETVSFDPRDVKHLSAMREKADKTLNEQVAQLHAEAEALKRTGPYVPPMVYDPKKGKMVKPGGDR